MDTRYMLTNLLKGQWEKQGVKILPGAWYVIGMAPKQIIDLGQY